MAVLFRFCCIVLLLLFFADRTDAADYEKHIQFHPSEPNTVGYLRVDDKEGSISQSTWIYIKNGLDYYKQHKPIFIILELNTPGGEVFPAMKISDALHQFDTQEGIPVVTVINNWAVSAGAMLAYSTRYITTARDGIMGAAEPVTIKNGEMQSASEKVNSAFRTDFANRAEFFGRNRLIAEKMVDKSSILVFRDNKITPLNSESEILPSDIVISNKDKLLTLNAEQMLKYQVADMILEPVMLEPLTAEEKSRGIWAGEKTPLFHQPFFNTIPQVTIHEYIPDWKTQLFMALAHPMVSSLLFFGLMMGFYMEMNTPGFGVAGSIAAICLTLIILSSFSQEIGSFLEVTLMLLGALILILDFTLLPTFGLLGFFGTLLFLVGLFAVMLPGLDSFNYEFDTNTWNAAGEIFMDRLTWYLITFVTGVLAILILARFISPSNRLFRRLVLSGGEQVASEGYTTAPDLASTPVRGTEGRAVTTLRPAGKAEFEDKLYDVISDGALIEKGTSILVVRTENGNIIVSAKEEKF